MIRVTALYPATPGARFDHAYYTKRHIPMVLEKLGAAAKACSIERGLAGAMPGSPAAFVALAHFTFESIEAFQEAFAAHGAAILGDIPNYTTIQPVLQISQIDFSR